MSRRAAREAALQILYKTDIAGGDIDVERELAYWIEALAAEDAGTEGERDNEGETATEARGILSKKNFAFALELIRGTLSHCDELDDKINTTAREWDPERIDVLNRNLMRLSLYEMFFCPAIPQRVSVNEAVELAKSFCGVESARFINGILDQFIAQEER